MNTRNKRASALACALAFRAVFPNPDGSLGNAADRAHSAYVYAGISSSISFSTANVFDLEARNDLRFEKENDGLYFDGPSSEDAES
jgi:hypothetical protein